MNRLRSGLTALFILSLFAVALRGQTSGGFQFPTGNYTSSITFAFGDPNPDYGGKLHTGEDIIAPTPGMPIQAAGDGKVMLARRWKNCPNWGYILVIEHTLADGSKASSIDGHLDPASVAVTEGQTILRSTFLGRTGKYSCWKEHLHFGLHLGSFGVPAGQYPVWLTGYLLPGLFPDGYVRPSDFILAHLSPSLLISTSTCPAGVSCTAPQQTAFQFVGSGFTPNGATHRFIVDSTGIQTELLPILSADSGGQISWSFASSCSTPVGAFSVFAIDQASGRTSNRVTETITPGNCPPPPTLPNCMLSASPGTINVGSTSTLSWTTTGNPTTATIDNGIGSVIPAGGSMTVSPVVSTTYTMTVTNVTDSATCSTLVTVNPLPIPTFTATGNLNVARAAHTATLLNDGRVLIVGGFTGNTDQSTASAEMYDPFTGMFTPTGSLNIARWGHSAVLLNDGRVLVVGGNKTCCQNYPVETELYDPISGAFSLGPSLPNALGGSALSVVPLVKMPDGTVLIVNGNRQITGATTDVLRYDPASNGVTLVGSTLVAHSGPQSGVALLNSGKILVTLEVFSELYDPVTNTSRATAGQMSEVRQRPAGVLLRDGRYVMAAGNRPDGSATGSLVIFDPSTEFYFDTGDRTIQGEGTVGTLLTDGRALFSGSTLMPGAAIFDPATNALTPIQPIDVHRQWHTATVLKDGRVLLAGGHPDVPVNSAELFVP